MSSLFMKGYHLLTVPVSILFILHSRRLHPAYRMGLFRRLALGWRMCLNTLRIPTATSYRAHLAMALKILETPPETPGDVVECGTWKGGSAANLSLACRIAGRRLRIYDSFEGLPEGRPGDREARHYRPGEYRGSLEEVRAHIARFGDIASCDFVPGWFEDTLARERGAVLLAFLDVDLEASLHTCVRGLWPRLVEGGYLFIDECVGTDYVALFYSETWWRRYFSTTPPGLIGAGTGLPLGDFYIGPWEERDDHPRQHASTAAYTRKGMSGHWSYYPDEPPGD